MISLIEILLFLLPKNSCKISLTCDNPFLGFNNGGNHNNRGKENNKKRKIPKIVAYVSCSKIILKDDYDIYKSALETCFLKTLEDLCLAFAKNCAKNPRTTDMFPLKTQPYHTRGAEKYVVTPANTDRLANSAITFMQRLLNTY